MRELRSNFKTNEGNMRRIFVVLAVLTFALISFSVPSAMAQQPAILGTVGASLSDGSAPDYVDTSLVNTTATSNGVYTLNYNAASAGQTLTIKWTANTTFNQWATSLCRQRHLRRNLSFRRSLTVN